MQATATRPSWTFFTNHAHVLFCIEGDPTVRIRDLALRVGITERAVQRIIAELEQDGYIEHERDGRRNLYHVNHDKHLRHSIESHQTIAAIVRLLRRKL
jgi:DNA-binding MarR family transcriptional regulator